MVSEGAGMVRSTCDSPGFPSVVLELIPLPTFINCPSGIWSSCCQNRLPGKGFAKHGGMLVQISPIAGQISQLLSLLDILESGQFA